MYYVSKRMEIAGSHSLKLSYESKCQNLHGHNWIITVYCKAKKLNKDGMVCDFKHIKEKIHGKLDHSNLMTYCHSIPPQRISPDGLSSRFLSAIRHQSERVRATSPFM